MLVNEIGGIVDFVVDHDEEVLGRRTALASSSEMQEGSSLSPQGFGMNPRSLYVSFFITRAYLL